MTHSGDKPMTTYEYLNLFASYGGLGLIYYGIRIMDRNAAMRAVDSERKHREAMARHDEAMTKSERRHEEAMEDIRRREEDSRRRHEEAMASLRELIERTR